MLKYASYNTVEQIVTNTKYLVNTKVGNLASLETENKSDLVSAVNELYSQVFLMAHPIGSIYMSTSNANPSDTYGGTWELWGSGRVPVGVNASDSDFSAAEKTGGAKTVNLAHSHTVNGHTHTISHTHSISHTHTVNSHNHTTGGHTLTINEIPRHNHDYGFEANGDGTRPGANPGHQGLAGCYASNDCKGHTGYNSSTGYVGGGASHNHGNTGNASPGTSGASTSTSGGASTGSSGNSSPGTNSQLSSAQSILQPYITCYMWKRTA